VLRSTIAGRIRVLAPPASARARLFGALFATIALLALPAAPAGALVVEPKAGERLGLQTREGVLPEVKPLQYHGGPIVTASDTYAIYWDPTAAYHSDWMALIDGYLREVGQASGQLGSVFSMSSQYTGPKGTRASYQSTFRGAYTDTQPFPKSGNCVEPKGEAVCLTDAQIRAELKRFLTAKELPTGTDVVYFVLTPPGVTVCTDGGENGNCSDSTATPTEEAEGVTNGICGYHAAIEPTSTSPIVYGVQPWIAGDAGRILAQTPLKTESTTQPVLACQNGEKLVEPNQTNEPSPYLDYETGLADVIIDDLSIEQGNIVIDPLLTGWYQEGTRAEQGDVCQGAYRPTGEPITGSENPNTHALSVTNETINQHHYYLQWAFNSVDVTSGRGLTCWQGGQAAIPHFTSPNPVNAGDLAAFDAKESNVFFNANLNNTLADEPFDAPIYSWNFGDSSPVVVGPEDASVLHSYTYGGVYDVTLTITDSAGNITSVTNPFTVVGPPPPSPAPSTSTTTAAVSPSTTLSTGSTSGASSKASGGSTASSSAPTPKLTETVASHALHKVLHHGLQIHYAVNQQVAGTVEVLLPLFTAKRLGISAGVVTLPKGYPRSVLIGYAVLVTTKAGHGALRVPIPAAVAQRLATMHKVRLTVRFQVHGSGHHPKVATTLTTVLLKG
jgi:hypothetical protein